MDWEIKEQLSTSITGLHLPRYHEIPNVGLYLEQTVKYINECLAPLTEEAITSSMVSNYVKRDLVDNPHKKQYSREQVAYLIFIALVKTVLSMDDIRLLISIQKDSYSSEVAYDYFCSELENVLAYIFGQKLELDNIGSDNTDEKVMLRNVIITAALKIYLGKLFSGLQKKE
ncbi:MAG: DUF1836 domain-containing protein [Clostridia bacterium]|nr:DUF1836 domain-containing protein [Clostridia bacterium]